MLAYDVSCLTSEEMEGLPLPFYRFRGVVQLFNAVRSQQKNLGSKLAEAHSTRMEEKLVKSIDKDAFLEHLTGKIRSRPVEAVEKAIKKEEVRIEV